VCSRRPVWVVSIRVWSLRVIRPSAVEPQRMVAEAAEADVGQPRPVVVGVDPQGEMVERRPQPAGGGDAGGQERHRVAERRQQRRERPVELVAEPAPAAVDQLVDQGRRFEHDRLAQLDAEVLERHGAQEDPAAGIPSSCGRVSRGRGG
jgi:hypothetical protein